MYINSKEKNLEKHPFFERWIDPDSGVKSYILTERVAPLQQSFYFVNSSFSLDEEWLWFYIAFPPSPYRMLAVVSMNYDNPKIYRFLKTAFDGETPMLSDEGDGVYYCMGPD